MIYTVTLSPALDKTIHLNNLEKGELNIINEVFLDPGGKGINTAKVLKALGSEVTSIAFLGGSTGDKINTMLNLSNISQKNIFINQETRTNIKIVESKNKVCTEINEKASPLQSVSLDDFDTLFENQLSDAKFITFAGRLPEGTDVGFYAKYIAKAKEKNIKTVLDTSGMAFKKGIEAKPWCIKPNINELSEYFDEKLVSERDIISKSKELNNLGIEIVIVTLGEEGVICTTCDEIIRVKAPKVLAQSTVGAGDSFVAGFLHKIAKGETIKSAIKYATAVSTAKVTLMGTNVPSLDDIEKYYNEIE